jgi:hypothetical protein
MTDVENRLRDALAHQADEVTPARLRFADGPRAVSSRRAGGVVRWLAPAAVAACVLAVAVAVAVFASGSGHRGTPAGGTGSADVAGLAGTGWRLDTVRRPDGSTVAIPERLSAGIAFERDRKSLGAGVGSSFTDARYTVTAAGDLVVTPVGTTASGYAGHDTAMVAALDAMTAITYGRSGQTTAQTVTVEIRPRLLRLSADGYVLTFVDELPLATSSVPICPPGTAACVSGTATGAPGTASAVPSFHS